ncbi:hypothetical protein [Qipengyuania flava]|uniref:hypothetical protein n=1 Tax=Qipengyuania flava TaxID=192812 RepID=UPI001C6349B8|nr:hypothetical protein [Qipengyuania flava]QYJ07994.1 hypothetical protein KUV82_04610 [Qipengyuania flava]
MSRLPLILAAATLAVLPLTAAAQTGTTPAATAPAEDAKAEDPVICRTEKVIGSRAKKRKTCMKRSQWAAVSRKGNTFARQMVIDHASIYSAH